MVATSIVHDPVLSDDSSLRPSAPRNKGPHVMCWPGLTTNGSRGIRAHYIYLMIAPNGSDVSDTV